MIVVMNVTGQRSIWYQRKGRFWFRWSPWPLFSAATAPSEVKTSWGDFPERGGRGCDRDLPERGGSTQGGCRVGMAHCFKLCDCQVVTVERPRRRIPALAAGPGAPVQRQMSFLVSRFHWIRGRRMEWCEIRDMANGELVGTTGMLLKIRTPTFKTGSS